MPTHRVWVAVVGIIALAACLRAIGLEQTFPGGGEVLLAPDDAQYHARRAWFSFQQLPQVLLFDSYLNFPKGAAIPWPPAYDLALAAAARLFGTSQSVFEHTLAWAPVALGSATAVGVFLATRQVASDAVALGAGLLYAWLPASLAYSRVGNPDHHAAVSFLATALLALSLAFFRADAGPRRIWSVQALLLVVRVAMLLAWHGSLLYLVLTEAALVAAAVLGGRREHLIALCVGQVATAAAIFPFVSHSTSEVGGALSPIELSLLHPILLVLFAWVAGASAELERRRPGAPALRRLGRACALGGVPVVAALALPATREGLDWAFRYVGREEQWIAANFEAQPLFSDGVALAIRKFGYAAIVLPFLPVFALALGRVVALRESAVVLATWSGLLTVLAFSNARYSNDLAPTASIVLSLGIAWAARTLHRRLPKLRVGAASTALGALLLAPVAVAEAPGAGQSVDYLLGLLGRPTPSLGENVAPNLAQSIHLFTRKVRAATPETAGYDDLRKPAYGVLSPPTLGFAMKYGARRPTAADNFGPYLGPPGLELTRLFYATRSEEKAVVIARDLRARYAVTTVPSSAEPGMMVDRLQRLDGVGGDGSEPLVHFRLIVDDPPIGVPLASLTGTTTRPVRSPYKLFEIVTGAVLRVRATPRSEVSARAAIETSTGRRFDYEVRAKANRWGVARLRVPYATSTDAPTRPLGPYTVLVNGRELRADVDDAQVRTGAIVEVQ